MKNKIRYAFEQDTPDILNLILQDCPAPEAALKHTTHTMPPERRKRTPADMIAGLATAAIWVLILGGVGVMLWQYQTNIFPPNMGTIPTAPTSIVTTTPIHPTTDPTTEPTTDPTTEPTAEPTTEPTPPPSTEPSQPSEPPVEKFESGIPGELSLYPFIFTDDFDGELLGGNRVNVESCVPGGLYIGQKNTNITYCITSDAVLCYETTNTYIYYALESDPQTLIRSTFDGTQQQAILHFSGTPAYFSVFGDTQGYVGTFEDDRHLVIYDIVTGEIECQWEQTIWEPEQISGKISFGSWDNSGVVEIIVIHPYPDDPHINEAGFALNPVTGEYRVAWVYSDDNEG